MLKHLHVWSQSRVQFQLTGRFIPPRRRKQQIQARAKYSESCDEQRMFHVIRASAVVQVDMNNNAIPNSHESSTAAADVIAPDCGERQVPVWIKTCLLPSALDDASLFHDAAAATLVMRTYCPSQRLPMFLHIVPDRARQNIADWLTSDPALMISIPMIPKLIPGQCYMYLCISFEYYSTLQ